MTLYVTDLDGTLLNSSARIKNRYTEMLNRMIRSGVNFTYATARGFQSSRKLTSALELKIPVITMNGAVIADPQTGDIIDIKHIDNRPLQTAFDFFAEYQESPLVYTIINGEEKVCYLKNHTTRIKKYLDQRSGDHRMLPCDDYSDLFKGDIFYLCLINPKSHIERLKNVFNSRNGFGINYQLDTYNKTEFWLEVFNKDVSKAQAAFKVKEITGADKLVVFGDNLNDIPMFSVSDKSFAVKNAALDVRLAANEVIGSNNSGAVILQIEKETTRIWQYEQKGSIITEPDSKKFKEAVLLQAASKNPGIGTLNEKSIHRTLKYYYSEQLNHEARVGGYYADILGENGITEIQTAGFNKLNAKLERFLEACHVTVVYPFEKRVNHINIDVQTGEVISRRTVNHKDLTRFFYELYRIKSFLTNPNLTICIAELEIEKNAYHKLSPKGGRNKSSVKYPMNLLSEIYLEKPSDYKIFLPNDLPERFTKAEFSKRSKLNKNGLLLEILEYTGIVENAGKSGNSFLYSVV